MIGYAILHCLGACDGAYHGNFLLDLFGTLRSKWVKVDPWDQNRENIFLHGMSRDFCILFLGFQVHGTGHHRKVSAVRMFFELDLASLHHHLPLFSSFSFAFSPFPGVGHYTKGLVWNAHIGSAWWDLQVAGAARVQNRLILRERPVSKISCDNAVCCNTCNYANTIAIIHIYYDSCCCCCSYYYYSYYSYYSYSYYSYYYSYHHHHHLLLTTDYLLLTTNY